MLISNASIEGPIKPVTDCSVEEFDAVIAINLRGVWLSVRAVVPELVRRGGGSMVLTSSISGAFGFPAASPYVASKHAVVGLARGFAQEVSAANIRVNAVLPGVIDNRMTGSFMEKFAPLAGTTPEGVRAMFDARVPMKRCGTDDEIAKLNLFLASADASYITGAAYVADGGITTGIM